MDKSNIGNAIIGLAGWSLANIPHVIESISGMITVITSVMGVIMLSVSIRTGIINYRMKKIEYRKAKQEADRENENAN